MNSAAERVEIFFDPKLGSHIVFRNAWLSNYASRALGPKWFLSNGAGGWAILRQEEYDELNSVALSESLFRKLEARQLVLTETNHGAYWDAYRKWTTPHFRHPVHHIVISTLRCNMACSYCHAAVVPPNAGKDYDLDGETAQAILAFSLNSRAVVQSFEFQGGESLLNRDTLRLLIPRIREAYKEAGKQVYLSVQTNGSLLTDGWMKFFEENDVSIGTSIDGPGELHDQQRPFAMVRETPNGTNPTGTYSIVARKAERYGLSSLPTITRRSLPFWKAIVDQQLQGDRRVVTFQPVYPINSAQKNWSDIGLSGSDFLQAYDTVVQYLRSLWHRDYYPLERRFRLALRKLVLLQDVEYADFGNPCGMVHSQIVYHTNGDVYTCDEGRDFPEFRLGNVKTDSYDEIVFGEKMRRLKSLSIRNDTECRNCAYRPFCSACPVYERAVEGSLVVHHAGTFGCLTTKYIFDTLLAWVSDNPVLLEDLIRYHGIADTDPNCG